METIIIYLKRFLEISSKLTQVLIEKLRVDDYILNRDNTNFIEDDVKNIKKYLKITI